MPVVQNMMKTEMIMNEASCLSDSTKLIAAPIMHMITTLYTLIPTYLESFRAGMLTWRVSHARKAPKICKNKKITKITINLFIYTFGEAADTEWIDMVHNYTLH